MATELSKTSQSQSFHRTLMLQFRSTRLLNCHSWTRVRAGRCRWSRCGRCAASACSPWSVRGARLASEPTALLPGSPAESPRSWCSAWPAAGSHSCWVFSRAGVWGWVSAALRRLCWHYVGASAHVCWWTPSLSWYCGTSAKNSILLYHHLNIRTWGKIKRILLIATSTNTYHFTLSWSSMNVGASAMKNRIWKIVQIAGKSSNVCLVKIKSCQVMAAVISQHPSSHSLNPWTNSSDGKQGCEGGDGVWLVLLIFIVIPLCDVAGCEWGWGWFLHLPLMRLNWLT